VAVAHLLFPVAADCHDGQDERLDGGSADHPRPDSLQKFRTKNFRRRSNAGEVSS
jgi:hypothetical protein